MQISMNWLKDYINLDGLTVDQVCASLTDIGLEVEAIAKSAAFGDTVVVGRIVSAEKHPNADTLRLCQVDVGKPELLKIVCGAPNARAGIDTCVALVGTILPGDLKIKEARIRSEESFGMMCSAKELALSDGHEGIIELAPGFKLGTPVIKVLGLDDVILTLNITPNRADCLGHIGVARDLSARLGKTIKIPTPTTQKSPSLSSKDIKVEIQTDRCDRFTVIAIKNVRAVSSPGWLKQRIEAVGMRSINLIVDATNYVMLEMNHPVHAYDDRDVKGRKFIIREAREGEKFRTLDDVERVLKAEDALICDGERPIGLAGIMGGMNSEIKSDTTSLILEVGSFDPISVRTTAKRLGIHSEASHRFERGIDMHRGDRVARRFGELLQICVAELNAAGAGLPMPEVAGDLVDVFPKVPNPRLIALRCSEAKRILACPTLTNDQIKKMFEGLEFRLADQNQDRLVFEIPTWRMDCERECDLVEEVGRLLGYDKVPYHLPSMTIEPTDEDPLVAFIEEARTDMASRGLRETICLPFWSDEDAGKMRIPADHPFMPSLEISNPITADSRWLHTTLSCGLIKAIENNRRHGTKGARIFELGRGYFDFNAKPVQRSAYSLFKTIDRKGRHLSLRAREEKNRPTERHWIAGIIDQPWTPKSWDTSETATTFFHAKAIVLAWLKGFGIVDIQVKRIEKDNVPFLHPGSSAYLFAKGQVVGWLGELHPEVAIAYGLEPTQPPMLFELDLETVLDLSSKRPKIATESFKFPSNTRDLALLVNSDLTHDAMAEVIGQFPQKKYLREWHIFDIFQGANIAQGKKSVAWSFSFQSAEKTLSDQDVDGEFKNLTNYLSTTLKAEQR